MVMAVCITFDSVSPYLRIYLEESIVDMGKDAYGRTFAEASSLIAKQKKPTFSSGTKSLQNGGLSRAVETFAAIKSHMLKYLLTWENV